MSFALMGVLFVFTPFLQVVQANDAQATGVRLLPLIGGIVLGALGSDRLVARLGVRLILALGLLVCGAGMALMSLVGAGSGYGLLLLALPVIGVGNSFATFTALRQDVEDDIEDTPADWLLVRRLDPGQPPHRCLSG
jgi:Na+/melibiose symporter-like transporter